jgi:hypothetical protein
VSTYGLLPVDVTTPVPSRVTEEHASAEPVDVAVVVCTQDLNAIDREVVSYVAPYASRYEAPRDIDPMGEYDTSEFGVEL